MIPKEIRADFNLDIVIADAAKNMPVGYTPKFILGGAPSSLTKDGVVNGEDITFSLLPTDTTNFATGQYWCQIVAENGAGGRVFIDSARVFLQGKITGSGAYDGRTVAEKILEAIDLAMLGKATKDQQSYVIQSGHGSRSLSRLDLSDLKEVRMLYAAIVAQERRAANGDPLFGRHKFAFVRD